MKTKIQLIAVLLTVLSSVAFANDGEKNTKKTTSYVEVKKKDAHTFSLVYKSANAEKVNIRLMDENNRVVFSETIKKYDAFARPYNLSNLPEGEYTLEVIDANGKTTKRIQNFSSSFTSHVKVPTYVKFDSVALNKYKLMIVSQTAKSARIKVYGKNGYEIYDANQKLNGNFAMLYDLSQVKAAIVQVEVNGQVNTFEL